MYQQTAEQLDGLELLLKQQQLWQSEPINPQARQSQLPFCHDTMTFEQWLQFVFIEKMRALIANKQPLPRNFAIAPMAEMMLSEHPAANKVIAQLKTLDNLLSDGHD